MSMTTGKKRFPIVFKIIVGLILGIILGIALQDKASYISPVGDLFMRMLKMLILPLVFCAIVSGVTGIPDMREMLRMGIKAFCLFVVMTALAIATGLAFGNIFQPGANAGLTIPNAAVKEVPELSFTGTLLNMVPTNVFYAFSNDNMLQVIVFAFFFGICIVLIGERGKTVKDFFDKSAQVMYKMTDIVIGFAPFGVCAMMADIIGQYGLSALLPLGKFLIAFHAAILFFFIVIQGGLILISCRINPFTFFKAILGSISMAYATDSSSAALPVAIKELEENMGVSDSVASFVMPVGTNVSKSGSALYQGIVAVFIAQVMGVDLTITQQCTVLLTALLASLGTAGVPSASLVMLTMTLNCVGLPLEGIALMAGIDRILGGARTFPNVVTNAAVSVILSRDESKYKER